MATDLELDIQFAQWVQNANAPVAVAGRVGVLEIQSCNVY